MFVHIMHMQLCRYVPQWHFANLTAYEEGERNRVGKKFVFHVSEKSINNISKTLEVLFATSVFSCPAFSNDLQTGGVRVIEHIKVLFRQTFQQDCKVFFFSMTAAPGTPPSSDRRGSPLT